MKPRHYSLAAAVLLAFIIVALVVWGYLLPKDLGEKKFAISIEQGDGFNKVARLLADQEVVRSELILKLAARLRNIDKKLIPGRYEFTGRISCKRVLDRLEDGDFLKIKVTIYEGAPIWKVASILQARLGFDSTTIMALAKDSAFCAQLGVPYLEGYLFPETYFVKWGKTEAEVLRDMVAIYRQMTDSIWPDTIPNGLTRDQIMVMASIIEAEAFLDKEKPKISSVYHNRLRDRWRLDADPTVIYGLGGLERPLNRRDLRMNSPYNTYRRRGLPPTPINSPGLASIEAALHPDTTEYYFFVADGTGGHRFSKTNAEHEAARREIRRANKQTAP
jgi:UPF0755 protein